MFRGCNRVLELGKDCAGSDAYETTRRSETSAPFFFSYFCGRISRFSELFSDSKVFPFVALLRGRSLPRSACVYAFGPRLSYPGKRENFDRKGFKRDGEKICRKVRSKNESDVIGRKPSVERRNVRGYIFFETFCCKVASFMRRAKLGEARMCVWRESLLTLPFEG